MPSSLPSLGLQFSLPFVALGVGGVITFFTAFRVASLFPSHMTVLLTAVNVLFDISATVPLFAFLLYHNSGFTRHAIFTPYAGYVAVVYATWIGVWSVYNRSAAPAPLLQQSGAAPAALTDKGEPLGSPPFASEGEAGGAEGRAAGSGDAGSPAAGGDGPEHPAPPAPPSPPSTRASAYGGRFDRGSSAWACSGSWLTSGGLTSTCVKSNTCSATSATATNASWPTSPPSSALRCN